jgi:O-antigen/teichoic acid export membrane protein
MKARLNKLRLWAGIDRPVFYTATGQIWSLVSGPITILVITHFFSPETQGYFYTFGSIIALQAFLELGFSQCIIQFASHEFARLAFQRDGQLGGDPRARSRLISLGRLSLKWYAIMAGLAVLGIGLSGYFFFQLKPNHSVDWVWPWWCLCLTTGLALCLQPIGALLEGCNQMSFVYGLRMLSRISVALVLWLSVWGGAQLYASALMGLTSVAILAAAYSWRWRHFLQQVWHSPIVESVSWRREIWPFQWRLAVSCVSGYFIFNLFVPVLFYFHGPVVAGKMGATMSLVASLNVLAQAWTVSKGPRFGMLISQKQYAELDRLFYRSTTQALAICILGGGALLLGLLIVQNHFAFGTRFLDLGPTCLLVLATIVNQIVFGQATYLRAHKREPFMVLSVVNGILTGLLMVGLGYFFEAWGVALAYTLVQTFILGWASVVWQRCRRDWHEDTLTA